jgi:dsDNA-specific endonuclease/ATPase MutS2
MPEETKVETTDAAEIAVSQTEAKQDEFDKERAMALIEKLRGEVKELKPKAKKAEELEAEAQKRADAELSEMEKLKKSLTDAEAKMKAYESQQLRRAAADKVGLPSVFADRLKGETPEELEADAKAILEAMPKPKATISATNPPDAKKGQTIDQRRAELYGTNTNIFDTAFAKTQGGGVRFIESGEHKVGGE